LKRINACRDAAAVSSRWQLFMQPDMTDTCCHSIAAIHGSQQLLRPWPGPGQPTYEQLPTQHTVFIDLRGVVPCTYLEPADVNAEHKRLQAANKLHTRHMTQASFCKW
jgi:hypothetical protein